MRFGIFVCGWKRGKKLSRYWIRFQFHMIYLIMPSTKQPSSKSATLPSLKNIRYYGILLAIYFADQITLYDKKWQLLVLLLVLQKRRCFREKLFCCIKTLNPRYDFFRCKYQRHPIMDRGYRVIWRCCQDGELLFFRSWLPDSCHVENFRKLALSHPTRPVQTFHQN